ncbi:hypothetical protein K7432_000580 [Basidiobolus ranarum]|uniref:DUF7729 domain-containing protein n=1 Tax=Basidiobolus ranarum TaxID=34480 RepID=A0ABR2WB24_9FUNG
MHSFNVNNLVFVSLMLTVLLREAYATLPVLLGTLGENDLTEGCQSYIHQVLASDDFQACKPFSFYLTLSRGFADLAKNASSIAPVIDEICVPGSDKMCEKVFKDMRSEFVKTQYCGNDMKKGNKVATTMYISFVNYHLMQRAGCLKNPEDEYCFVEAVTRRSQLDVFFMPYGHQLGNGKNGVPQLCTSCSQQIMNLYSRFGSQYLNPLRKSFDSSKMLMTQQCGNAYAKMLKNHMNSASSMHPFLPTLIWLTLTTLVATLFRDIM